MGIVTVLQGFWKIVTATTKDVWWWEDNYLYFLYITHITQLNESALEVLKHYYITERILERLIGNSRFLINNSLNQLPYYMDIKGSCLFVAETEEKLDLNN